jgi:ABC-type multidrug transport system ATPase subunit
MKSLKFENITFGYDAKIPIFQNLSFEIKTPTLNKGHITALMGSSGSGKSTLLKLILGTEKPQKGNILCNPQQPIIAYLPQEPILFEHLSAIQNARYFESTSFYKKRFDEILFSELVQSLNIFDVLQTQKSVSELSGGQRQRLSLLRALSIRPDILLLDEPTNGLDAEVKLQFLNKLREIVLKYNLLVIYVTHHKLETELLVDEIIYLSKDEQTGYINRIFQDSLLGFIEKPPLLEAVKVFNYPKPNLLKFSLDSNYLKQYQNDMTDFFYLCIEDKQIKFSPDKGFDYKIISSNPIYSLLELTDSQQILSVYSGVVPNDSNMKLHLDGNILQYKADNFFDKVVNIQNNQII